MKQFFITVFLICSATLCFGQGQLEIKIFGSPTLSYRMITGDKEFRELLNDGNKPSMRYETGVLVTVKKLSRMDLEVGLVLSRKGFSVAEISLRDVNNEPSGSMKVRLSTDFLEIPFRLNYYLSESKRNYLIAGASADFLIGSKYHYEIDGDLSSLDQEQPKGLRKFNTGLQIGYGYRLVNSNGFGLDLEPNFKIQVMDSNTETSSIDMHFYSVGLACKFRVKV